MASDEPAGLTSLPSELVLHILVILRTADLAPLAELNRRFHDLVVRILAHRLRIAASLHSHSLLLEGYHPSQRLTEPPYPCLYLGTDGLDVGASYNEPLGGLAPGQRLRELAGLYSRFRPYRRKIERVNPMRHPAGDVPGSRTFTSANNGSNPNGNPSPDPAPTGPVDTAGEPSTQASAASPKPQIQQEKQQPAYEPVIQKAHLEAGVRFTQLCADTTVTIAGPRPGLFVCYQHVDKGVLRVFRDWLADRAALDARSNDRLDAPLDEDVEEDEPEPSEHAPQTQSYNGKAPKSAAAVDVRADPGVLWVSNRYSVGIRFGVRQPKWRPQHSPILVRADEELPVSYEIEYEELLVRTKDLLLASEKADEKQQNTSGKAIVIGAWAASG